MDTSLLLAEKVAASAAIGLLIGLERERAHKETGVRSFTIATPLGTLAWIVLASAGLCRSERRPGRYYPCQRLLVNTRSTLADYHITGIGGNKYIGYACRGMVSATSSAVLIGNHASMHLLAPTPVAAVIFFATLMGLVENVVIFFVASRERGITLRMALLSLPIILVRMVALVLLVLFG